MTRITRPQMFMEMARAASKRSTCFRLAVGCILTVRDNVVAMGYNGAPASQPHCGGNKCQWYQPPAKGMVEGRCTVVHAEANALVRCQGKATEMFVTHSPCGECAKLIEASTIMSVYYEIEYRDRTPIHRLIADDRDVYKLLPSGLVIDQRTGQLMQT